MTADLALILGRGGLLLDVLDDEPLSIRALVAETGIPRSTVQRYLEALEEVGRAERTRAGWTRPSVDALFAPLHKDFEACPGTRDDPADRAVRWAA